MRRFVVAALFAVASCNKPSQNTQALSPEALKQRGDMVYHSFCIACHNPDPSKDGILGPAVTGSSLELLQARVLHATYPEGYKPKRPSKIMYAIPQIEKDIPALHAFLNASSH